MNASDIPSSASVLLSLINSDDNRPCDAEYEKYGAGDIKMKLHCAGEKARQYFYDGAEKVEGNFEIRMMVRAGGVMSRLSAVTELNRLCHNLRRAEFDSDDGSLGFTYLSLVSLPRLTAIFDDGSAEYSVGFVFGYVIP